MIILGQSSTSLDAPIHFATKRTGIDMIFLNTIGLQVDFCTCIAQCVPCLKSFTDEVGTDFYKNDKFFQYLNIAKGGTNQICLIKINPGGAETVIVVTDDTYGILVESLIDVPRFVSYEWDFFKIWGLLGYGKYRFEIKQLSVAGNPIQSIQSPTFCLQRYTDQAANGTIRIETTQTGRIRSGNNYGDAIYNQQIRLPGELVFKELASENDSEQLNNDSRSLIQIKDQLNPEYTLTIKLASAPQLMLTLFDYLFANDVKISDYNVFNFVANPEDLQADMYRSIPLKRNGTDFKPSSRVKRKTFNFNMEYANKNVFKINN